MEKGKKENRRSLGTDKEELAMEYLKEQGYRILNHSFRCRIGEIDIVAKDGGYLVFIEVKYRKTSAASGLPEYAVSKSKMRTISRVATYYLMKEKKGMDTPCRFDVVAIDGDQIRLHKNAFPFQG